MTDPRNDIHDLSFAGTVGDGSDDEEMLIILSGEALLEEMGDDPTIDAVDRGPDAPPLPKRGPKLTAQQQMQVAIWIVEGESFRKAMPMMMKLWGFTITERAWRYYKTFRRDLLKDAGRFIESVELSQGFATKATRVKRLGRMINRLEAYMEQHGLEEVDQHQVGYGKSLESVTTVKFAAALAKEYREAMALMDKWTGHTEKKVTGLLSDGQESIDPATAAQFQLAAGWKPQGEGAA